jgi:hypothetical protein
VYHAIKHNDSFLSSWGCWHIPFPIHEALVRPHVQPNKSILI